MCKYKLSNKNRIIMRQTRHYLLIILIIATALGIYSCDISSVTPADKVDSQNIVLIDSTNINDISIEIVEPLLEEEVQAVAVTEEIVVDEYVPEVEMAVTVEPQKEDAELSPVEHQEAVQLKKHVDKKTIKANSEEKETMKNPSTVSDSKGGSNSIEDSKGHDQNNSDSKNNDETDKDNKSDNYRVELSIDDIIKKGNEVLLGIWIGDANDKKQINKHKITAETEISKEFGNYAKVSPIATGFDIIGDDEECFEIVSSGSKVYFKLKALHTGDFKISANIEIFDNKKCSGAGVPKAAEVLTVRVKVDSEAIINSKLEELGSTTWDKFIVFFGSFISLIFAFILYKFRKKLKITKEN